MQSVLLLWLGAVTSVVAGDFVGLANDVVGRQRVVSCARDGARPKYKVVRYDDEPVDNMAYSGQRRVLCLPRFSWLKNRVSLSFRHFQLGRKHSNHASPLCTSGTSVGQQQSRNRM